LISFCEDKEKKSGWKVADQTCFAFLVQHQNEKEIGLMILKTYLWRKHGDEDYVVPKIQLIKKDLFSSYTV
jgi:hypothetical protein